MRHERSRSSGLAHAAKGGPGSAGATPDIQDILGPVKRKVLLSLDGDLLGRLDRAARDRAVSRSALVTELTDKYLEPSAARRRGIRRSLRRLDELARKYGDGSGEDTTTFVREQRDARSRRSA